MAINTLADAKNQFNSQYPSTQNISGMNSTYQTEPSLGNVYSFSLTYILKGVVQLGIASQDTFWIDHAKNIVDRMLSRRDDRSDTLGEWDATIGYPGGGPVYYGVGRPGYHTGAPVWHRIENGGPRALELDCGQICNGIMQYVDAVRTYPAFASYVTDTEQMMDDCKETFDAFNQDDDLQYSCWRYNIVGAQGGYGIEQPDGNGLYSNIWQLNHQATFLVAQLIYNKYRPDVNMVNKATAHAQFFLDRLYDVENNAYDWPYNGVTPTQDLTGDCHSTPISYCSEDVTHGLMNTEFAYYAWKQGIVFTDLDMDKFANGYIHNINQGSGVASWSVRGNAARRSNEKTECITWPRLYERDTAVVTTARSFFDDNIDEPPSTPKAWNSTGDLLFGENPPGAGNPDVTAPTVSISTPADGSDHTSLPIPMTGTAADTESGVALVEVSVQGGVWQSATGTTSWSYNATVGSGVNTLDARATDVAGNVSTVDRITVTYTPPDTTKPLVSITSPADMSIVTEATQLVSGTASDPGSPSSGVDRVEVRINDGPWEIASGTTSWTHPLGLTLGLNTIDAVAYDVAGNDSSMDSHQVTLQIESTPPILTVTSHANNDVQFAGAVTISGTASDADSGLSYIEASIDGGQTYHAATGTDNWSVTIPMGAGATTFTVRAWDVAGNSTTETVNVTIRSKISAVLIGG